MVNYLSLKISDKAFMAKNLSQHLCSKTILDY